VRSPRHGNERDGDDGDPRAVARGCDGMGDRGDAGATRWYLLPRGAREAIPSAPRLTWRMYVSRSSQLVWVIGALMWAGCPASPGGATEEGPPDETPAAAAHDPEGPAPETPSQPGVEPGHERGDVPPDEPPDEPADTPEAGVDGAEGAPSALIIRGGVPMISLEVDGRWSLGGERFCPLRCVLEGVPAGRRHVAVRIGPPGDFEYGGVLDIPAGADVFIDVAPHEGRDDVAEVDPEEDGDGEPTEPTSHGGVVVTAVAPHGSTDRSGAPEPRPGPPMRCPPGQELVEDWDLVVDGGDVEAPAWGRGCASRAADGRLRRQGRWERWHLNGRKALEVTYQDGAKHGTLTVWRAAGGLYGQSEWTAGARVPGSERSFEAVAPLAPWDGPRDATPAQARAIASALGCPAEALTDAGCAHCVALDEALAVAAPPDDGAPDAIDIVLGRFGEGVETAAMVTVVGCSDRASGDHQVYVLGLRDGGWEPLAAWGYNDRAQCVFPRRHDGREHIVCAVTSGAQGCYDATLDSPRALAVEGEIDLPAERECMGRDVRITGVEDRDADGAEDVLFTVDGAPHRLRQGPRGFELLPVDAE